MEKTKKQHILEAAALLFRDRGYSATSMRDLAEAVDLRASSLYNHIDSKQELLKDICFANAHRFLSGIQQIEQKHDATEARVRALLHLHIQLATEDFTSIISFNDEWRHLEEPYLSDFRKLRKQYEDRFKLILETGMQEGSFKTGDLTIVLYTLLSSIRWVYDWYKPGRSLQANDIAEMVAAIVLDGLKN